MRPWVTVVCGVVLIAVALIVEAPASVADWRVGAMTGDRLHIANASGTLWNGSGDLVASGSALQRHSAWQRERWPPLRGELRGTLAMEALLRAAGAPAIITSAGGDFDIHIDRFIQDADALDVALAMQWRNASLPGLGHFARVMLGDLRAELSGRGHEVSGPLGNTGGEVEIDGTVTAVGDGTPRVEAKVRARPGIDRERASALAFALSTLGPADSEGRVRVAWPR